LQNEHHTNKQYNTQVVLCVNKMILFSVAWLSEFLVWWSVDKPISGLENLQRAKTSMF